MGSDFPTVRPVPTGLEVLAERVRPRVLARDELVPVDAVFTGLLGSEGLRRGSTVIVENGGAPGSTSVALGLLAEATTAGMWCAVVGFPSLGVLAATELGVALDRLVLIPSAAPRPAAVLAALLDGCDVVVAALETPMTHGDARRLAARARERRCVLLVCPQGDVRFPEMREGSWPDVPDIAIRVTGGRFTGLGEGVGHLRGHLVEMVATRRRVSPRTLQTGIWLPGPDGRLAPADAVPLGNPVLDEAAGFR